MQRFYPGAGSNPGRKKAAVWRIKSLSPDQILAPIAMK
jgi:hypothetical protein